MRQSKFNVLIYATLVFVLCSGKLLAVDNTTLKSSYLGDGLFKYEMTVHDDPFFLEEKNSFAILSITNLIEVVEHSPNWQFSNHTNAFSLGYPEGNPDIERPYSAYCIVKSSYTNYCTIPAEETGAIVHGSLLYLDDIFGNPYGSGNVVFYSKMNAIVPCSEENADGSPPVCEHHFEYIPDLKINNLIMEDGRPKGLSFSWDSDCTVVIQASTNLTDWTDVEYTLGSPPSTNWFSSVPLEGYGNSYRILLAANGHHPELLSGAVPMKMAMVQPEEETSVSFNIQCIQKGHMRLTIDTTPEKKYAVSLKHNRTGEIFKNLTFTAVEEHTTMTVDLTGLPASASVDVTKIELSQ